MNSQGHKLAQNFYGIFYPAGRKVWIFNIFPSFLFFFFKQSSSSSLMLSCKYQEENCTVIYGYLETTEFAIWFFCRELHFWVSTVQYFRVNYISGRCLTEEVSPQLLFAEVGKVCVNFGLLSGSSTRKTEYLLNVHYSESPLWN